MTYTWPTAFCCMFSVFLSFYPFLAVSIFAFFIWVNTLRNVYKRIEDEESRGITAHNTKDKKIQEQTYLQMTDEQKASFQASLKKPMVNIWIFAGLFWDCICNYVFTTTSN